MTRVVNIDGEGEWWRNGIYAVAFAVMQFILIGVCLDERAWRKADERSLAFEWRAMRWACVLSVLYTVGALWLHLQKTFERAVLRGVPVLAFVALAWLAFIYLQNGHTLMCLTVSGFAAGVALWLYRNRGSRTEFAGVLHQMLADWLLVRRSLIVLAAALLGIQLLWFVFFVPIVVEALYRSQREYWEYVLLAFCAYWSSQVCKHLLTCIVCAGVVEWYHSDEGDERLEIDGTTDHVSKHGVDGIALHETRGLMSKEAADDDEGALVDRDGIADDDDGMGSVRPAQSTVAGTRRDKWRWDVAGRALKKTAPSFGTICFASLFVSAVRVSWGAVHHCLGLGRALPSVVRRLLCLPCIVSEGLGRTAYRHFNKYGMVHVVGRGATYRAASQDMLRQFRRRRIDAILQEDRLDTLLLLPALGGAAAVTATILHVEHDIAVELSVAIFVISFIVASLGFELIEAACTALYACFALEPLRLRRTHPLIFHRFVRLAEFARLEASAPRDDADITNRDIAFDDNDDADDGEEETLAHPVQDML